MARLSARSGRIVAALVLIVGVPVLSQDRGAPRATTDVVSFRIVVVESAAEAERVREQLSKGENFVALARSVSVDPSRESGGLLGPVALSELRPELRSVLEVLPVGELSSIVRLPTGFAIVKIVPDSEAAAGAGGLGATVTSPIMGNVSPALAAAGSVKYVFELSGYIESILSLREVPLPPGGDEDPRTVCGVRSRLEAATRSSVESFLASKAAADVTPLDLAQAYFLLGQLHAFAGAMGPAIGAFEKARQVSLANEPALLLQLDEALGVAHLHKAGLDNGVFHAPGDRCLLSHRHAQPYVKPADAVKAAEYFSRYLAEKPDELEVRWLLNLAHMAAGTYPDGVPRAQLIPPDLIASKEDVGRFVDVAPRAGLVSVASAGGVIVDDFDNDGRLDVVTSSLDSCAPMRFFRLTGEGTFMEQASRAGLADQLGGLNILHADYNNDGHLDILVLRGAWETPQRKSLLRNNGNGSFTDVTVASGLASPATRTQTAVWTDIDNDGHLDLFVGNEEGPAQLFRNKGNGTFEDIAPRAGVDRRAFNKGVAAADYDNDGWPDLYVSNLGSTNFLYRNNRDGTFTELGRGAGVPGPGQGFPTWFFDYDNDGRQDVFVGSFVTSVDETARAFLRLPRLANTMKLYRNLGDGSFEDVTRQVGLDMAVMAMGANFGDIDNDGFLDIYLGTGNPSYAALVPSVLLRNRGGTSFVDVTASSGTGELHKGHGVAFADLDNDGDEEIVFEVGGATPGDAHALRLFENPGHGHDWIVLKLVGVKTNRAAMGARITVTVDTGEGRRAIHRSVGTGGSFGASPLQQHIGLGRGAKRVDVEIWWPTSNTRQRFANVEKNAFLQLTEFARDYARLPRPSFRLGGSKADDAAVAR